MLNLSCVICTELFKHSDGVHVTHCGHMFHIVCLKQWIDRSKSCPQCRNKCTDRNIFRVYFNIANLDTSHIDVGSLQEQLDNVNLSLKMKENEVNKAQEYIKDLKEIQRKCLKTISGLECKVQNNDLMMMSYREQIKSLKTEIVIVADLRNTVQRLKEELTLKESISTLLTCSNTEFEKLLKTESDPKKLAVWVTTLKRELRNSEQKKADLRNLLKCVQNDLRKETAMKKIQEERISELESENYQLTEKLKAFENENENKKIEKTIDSLRLSIGNELCDALNREEKRLTISPTIKENVKKIEESNSPYFNIKSSSIGLVPLFKRNHDNLTDKPIIMTANTIKVLPLEKQISRGKTLRPADSSEKLSIFKKPRIGTVAASASAGSAAFMKPLGPNFVFKKNNLLSKGDTSNEDVEMNNDGPSGSKMPTTITSSNLNNRLKIGSLRNFRTTLK